MIVHAGLVALPVAGRWKGVLICGPSGSGKSDLALRLLDDGLVLVADDRTLLWTSGGRLFGRALESLAGLVEARGVGVIPAASHAFAEVVLTVECAAGMIERLPDPETAQYLDHDIPLVRLAATEASAPAKVRRALMALG